MQMKVKANTKPLPEELNTLSRNVLDAAYKVHTAFGPGLLENVYELFLVHELKQRGLNVHRQVPIDLEMDGFKLEGGLRLDVLVENELILELKAVESLEPVHTAQVLTYLKLTRKRLGLLINFNVTHLKTGIRRVVL
jgi:GxxExxY protein